MQILRQTVDIELTFLQFASKYLAASDLRAMSVLDATALSKLFDVLRGVKKHKRAHMYRCNVVDNQRLITVSLSLHVRN